MNLTRILAVAMCVMCALPVLAQGTWDNPLPDPEPYPVDTGFLTNSSRAQSVIFDATIDKPEAKWMRLYFGEVELAHGSFIRITSLMDGEVQELNAADLEMWSNTTAYFNGQVKVELVAGPQTANNRMVIDQLAWAPISAIPQVGCDPGCCGPTDDRVPSNMLWSNRLVPAGCSAAIYNTDSCAVSAGHCASGGMVLQFNVPPSNPNCSLNSPPVTEQFPVTGFQFTNGGPGNDWLAMTVGNNNLGEKPFERYGEFRPIKNGPATVGTPATVWGYGVDDTCTTSQTQQTSDGFIEFSGSTLMRYSIDVTYGNSGSSVLENGDTIAGIVTHCCCPNQGTQMTHPAFVAAREALCPSTPAQAASLVSATVLKGTGVSVDIADMESSDGSHFEVDSELNGPRNNTLTEIVAQSPFGTASQLNLVVEFGPVNVNPIFLVIQIHNNNTGIWNNLSFGILSTTSDTTIELPAIASPNSYVDGSGEIRLRVGVTARAPQTPGGFTKLIDMVSITTKP